MITLYFPRLNKRILRLFRLDNHKGIIVYMTPTRYLGVLFLVGVICFVFGGMML